MPQDIFSEKLLTLQQIEKSIICLRTFFHQLQNLNDLKCECLHLYKNNVWHMCGNILTHLLSQLYIFLKHIYLNIHYVYHLTSEQNYYAFMDVNSQVGENRYAYGCNYPVAQLRQVLKNFSQDLFLLNLTQNSQPSHLKINGQIITCSSYRHSAIFMALPRYCYSHQIYTKS